MIPAHEQEGRALTLLNEVARAAVLDLDLRPMLQRVTNSLFHFFDCELVACATVDEEQSRFVFEAIASKLPTSIKVGSGRELGSGIVGIVAQRGDPVVLDDVREVPEYIRVSEHALSEACIPVFHANRLVAILDLESREVGFFRDKISLLQTVAEQVAGSISGAHLYKEVWWQARALEMLNEMGRTILEADDLEEVLDRTTSYMVERLGMSVANVLLLDATGEFFDVASFSGEHEMKFPSGDRWPVSVGVSGRCARTGEPQLIMDVDADPDYVASDEFIRAEYCVPISQNDEILGVLNVESRDPAVFSSRRLGTIRSMANQAAGAIRMARLNERLVESRRVVEEKTELLRETNERLEKANTELERLSTVDFLTQVPNRRRFDEVLDKEWRRALRTRRALALLFVDVDHFKDYNDTHGHQKGDECLRLVAESLKGELRRAADFVARYGGEEFALILPETDSGQAGAQAERIRNAVENLVPLPGEPGGGRLTISIGVATSEIIENGDSSDLVRLADNALYRAKKDGRNRVVIGA